MLKHLPNALTVMRILLAPAVGYALWRAYRAASAATETPDGTVWALAAAGLFIIAAFTDLFDGMAARAFNAESKLGRLLDPIADKVLVGFPLAAISLIALSAKAPMAPVIIIATMVIVVRDVAITWMRFSAPDGEGVRVSQLAKWKTAIELIVVGAPVLLAALQSVLKPLALGVLVIAGPEALAVWTALLVLSAGLSAFTAWRYVAK